jgi:hypothetical protein
LISRKSKERSSQIELKESSSPEILQAIIGWWWKKHTFRSWVSLEFLKGMCFFPSHRALMQLLRARRERFMLAPSTDLKVR